MCLHLENDLTSEEVVTIGLKNNLNSVSALGNANRILYLIMTGGLNFLFFICVILFNIGMEELSLEVLKLWVAPPRGALLIVWGARVFCMRDVFTLKEI